MSFKTTPQANLSAAIVAVNLLWCLSIMAALLPICRASVCMSVLLASSACVAFITGIEERSLPIH